MEKKFERCFWVPVDKMEKKLKSMFKSDNQKQ